MRQVPKMLPLWFFLVAASVAVGSPTNSTGAALRACVSDLFGSTADLRVVDPSNDTYTDARIGEQIQ